MNSIIRFKKIELPFPLECGVISDTHDYSLPEGVDDELSIHFSGFKHILHLGDVTHPSLLNDMEVMGYKVVAVQGNNDRMLFNPHVILLKVGDYNIGMVHGSGGSFYNVEKRSLRIFRSVSPERLDALIFGHTHVPRNIEIDGIKLLNPGSMTMPRIDPEGIFPTLPSLAILKVNDDGIDFNIFNF